MTPLSYVTYFAASALRRYLCLCAYALCNAERCCFQTCFFLVVVSFSRDDVPCVSVAAIGVFVFVSWSASSVGPELC